MARVAPTGADTARAKSGPRMDANEREFPLTPTLSPKEREPRRPSLNRLESLVLAWRRQACSLSFGERVGVRGNGAHRLPLFYSCVGLH